MNVENIILILPTNGTMNAVMASQISAICDLSTETAEVTRIILHNGTTLDISTKSGIWLELWWYALRANAVGLLIDVQSASAVEALKKYESESMPSRCFGFDTVIPRPT
jgi:hypothetical protein